MFKNYLKVALRNIRRRKAYALINIGGWAAGMTVCILILLWVHGELSFDRFHENANRIYRLTTALAGAGADSVAPTPAGPALVEEFPEVIRATRLDGFYREVVRFEDKDHRLEDVGTVDQAFLEMFSFPFLEGDPAAALTRPHTVVLTERTARRIFGLASPLGKFLRMQDGTECAITGVLADVPRASDLRFDMLKSFETLAADNRSAVEDWFVISMSVYVLLEKGADAGALEAKLPAFVDRHMGPRLRAIGGGLTLNLQPLRRVHLYSGDFAYGSSPGGDIGAVLLFSAIAVLVLLVASINFVNLSTARAATRAKEVGLRKTLGAARPRLVGQFLAESVLYSLLAMVLALGLHPLGLKAFGRAIGRPLETNVFQVPWMAPALFALAVVVGLAAGAYPALRLSAFEPVRVLKGRLRTGGGVWFRRILVATQFAISALLIIGTLAVNRQIRFVKTTPLGFDMEQVLVIPRRPAAFRGSMASVRTELLGVPGVIDAGASSLVPGLGMAQSPFWPEGSPEDEPQLMDVLSVDEHFLSTLGIEIAAGRGFSEMEATGLSEAVLINRTAARRLGWDDPVGRRFVVRGRGGPADGGPTSLTVLGMIEDYHTTSLRRPIEPQLIRYNPERPRMMISVRLSAGDVARTLDGIRAVWARLAPGEPFDYLFLDESFDEQYRADERLKTVTLDFSVLAVLIACLGLFGIASFSVERRTREIGIRKALGSSAAGIVRLLSKETVVLIAVSNAIAWPIGGLLMNAWLRGFAYRAPLTLWVFLAALGLSLLAAGATIGLKSVRAALANPSDALRCE